MAKLSLITELRAALADDPETGPIATIAPDCSRLAAALEAEEANREFVESGFHKETGSQALAESASMYPEKPVRAPSVPSPLSQGACHTSRAYEPLTRAYGYFNRELFGGALPSCIITLQRKAKTFGYFAGDRFGSLDKSETTHEIALNPSHFASRSTREVLATLVHEMCHLERHLLPKAKSNGYHCKVWAGLMRQVGLIPSSTGEPGGKETGKRVSHYIEKGGRFDQACSAFLGTGFELAYIELWDANRKKKAASSLKVKYSCEVCGLNAWAKPEALFMCGECGTMLETQ